MPIKAFIFDWGDVLAIIDTQGFAKTIAERHGLAAEKFHEIELGHRIKNNAGTLTDSKYVKAINKGLKAYQNTPTNVKVQVYFPEDDTIYNHFAKPTKTFYLNLAASSPNADARYWQVFSVLRNDFAWQLFHDPTHAASVQPILEAISQKPLINGRFVTEVEGFFK